MTVQMSFVLPGRSRVPRLDRDIQTGPPSAKLKSSGYRYKIGPLLLQLQWCRPATGCICEALNEVKLVILMDE